MTIYNMIEVCDACGIDTSRLRIVVYLLEHSDLENGSVEKSYTEISQALGVSYSVVAKTMALLKKEGMIQSVGRGKWKWLVKLVEPVTEEDDDESFSLYVKNYCVE